MPRGPRSEKPRGGLRLRPRFRRAESSSPEREVLTVVCPLLVCMIYLNNHLMDKRKLCLYGVSGAHSTFCLGVS
jgi:hypothetical protein